VKRVLSVLLVLGLGLLLVSGCQQNSTTSQTRTLSDANADGYSQMGINLVQGLNESVSEWVTSGAVNVGVIGSSVRGSSVRAQTITGPDGSGYYHVVESTMEGSVTIEADVYVKLVKDNVGRVIDTYVYGGYSYKIASIIYSVTFGSGSAIPYHATASWTGDQVTNITASGPISMTVTAGSATASHTIVMTFALSNFSIPVATGYPSGTITISISYDGTADPINIVITFNGSANATLVYGIHSALIPVPPIVIP
jgi:hypothetical protein